ncbi:hypothetical protein HS041_28040 [Planomonospora sp. ID67723]|uniref:hypothetical protein n=1 Tax=Planomonospora sp. ID67723 TaxID=2738134 RepID=UPI0018C403B4|nr:hypothetical protein [Planomonospora sp. ID67723]MBG0831588.1 hypothetical protein [Planomonospora sp. ID67723]
MNTPARLLAFALLGTLCSLTGIAPAAAEPSPVTVQATVSYTCQAPLGTGAAAAMQATANIPTTAMAGKPVAIEWNLTTGLLAVDDRPAGSIAQRAVLTVSGSQSGTITTSSAATTSALTAGQALQLPPMKGTVTPDRTGSLTLTPGNLTVTITHNGTQQQTLCTVDAAAPALATITVTTAGSTPTATPSASPTPPPTPTPKPTPTVTVTATPTRSTTSESLVQTEVTPKGGASTGGGGLSEANIWPYAAAGAGLLLVIGLGLEIRRKRIHGY